MTCVGSLLDKDCNISPPSRDTLKYLRNFTFYFNFISEFHPWPFPPPCRGQHYIGSQEDRHWDTVHCLVSTSGLVINHLIPLIRSYTGKPSIY